MNKVASRQYICGIKTFISILLISLLVAYILVQTFEVKKFTEMTIFVIYLGYYVFCVLCTFLIVTVFNIIFDFIYSSKKYSKMCYLPVTVEEIAKLKLTTISDYVYLIARVMNNSDNPCKKDNIHTYKCIYGYKLSSDMQESIKQMFLERYKYSLVKDCDFFSFLRFVSSKEDAEGLCKAFLEEVSQ